MKKQYVIQLIFYQGKKKFSFFWHTDCQAFRGARPREGFPLEDLDFEMENAGQHARQVLRGITFWQLHGELKPAPAAARPPAAAQAVAMACTEGGAP